MLLYLYCSNLSTFIVRTCGSLRPYVMEIEQLIIASCVQFVLFHKTATKFCNLNAKNAKENCGCEVIFPFGYSDDIYSISIFHIIFMGSKVTLENQNVAL